MANNQALVINNACVIITIMSYWCRVIDQIVFKSSMCNYTYTVCLNIKQVLTAMIELLKQSEIHRTFTSRTHYTVVSVAADLLPLKLWLDNIGYSSLVNLKCLRKDAIKEAY